jgi:hypothetical protein
MRAEAFTVVVPAKLERSFLRVQPDDLRDGLAYMQDIEPDSSLDATPLVFRGIRQIPPEKFIDDPSHLGAEPRGWLLHLPRAEWAEALRYAYDRTFEHSLTMLNARTMAPSIEIDGQMADGRGRAQLHWALGRRRMPVAIFRHDQ